ncbi:MAG: lamin tail domain-containing protein [Ilumatobacter sp.]|uniref:lamin tail domain-containing protein n=1 Tax=Ilumatobacter sp. TaxID=1967498 RepID=UPI00329776EA
MKRSTVLIGCSLVAATVAATFQFAGGLGGDAPAAGESEVTAPTSPADDSVRDVLDLLGSLTVADPDPARPAYDRDTYQPDGWADLDGDCISGRHEVLATQSRIPVVMDPSGCFVESGSWTDPYTGTVVTQATDITIDHVVPLSAAHRAGAWRWDPETKIAFANDEAPGVLVAVVGSVNQAKGDMTPDRWLPPRREHHCAYASNWVSTKARWQLSVTAPEAATLEQILSSCAPADIPSRPASEPSVIVLAPPVTSTTIGGVVVPVDGSGVGDVRIAQCQRREERVVLVNPTAASISLVGYELHDEESRHSTLLDRFGSIDAGATLVVLTGEEAVESPGEVVWKPQNVWNNDGDTAFLVTPSGSVSSVRC